MTNADPAGDSLPRLAAELTERFHPRPRAVMVGSRTIELLLPPSVDDLISEEEFAIDERLPYWAEIWPAARALAAVLAEERGNGRTLLELGCGAGLVAVAACQAGFEVTATDYYQPALDFTRLNAWRAAGVEPRTRVVDWRNLPRDLGRFDMVVAADVLYEKGYLQLVAGAFARCLAPSGVGLMADPQRQAAEGFADACRRAGLRVETPPPKLVTHLGREQPIDLFRLTLPAT